MWIIDSNNRIMISMKKIQKDSLNLKNYKKQKFNIKLIHNLLKKKSIDTISLNKRKVSYFI
jgi:hypothetical protein